MRAVLRLAAHEIRARWLGWAVLALLVGLAGGVVFTAAAGARRTDSAYPRFLAASKASDMLVSPAGLGIGGFDDALAGLPGVAAIAPIVLLQALPLEPDGKLDGNASVAAPLDHRYGHTLEIPRIIAGRQPDPDRPGEVMVDNIAAQDLHLRVAIGLAPGRGPVASPTLLSGRLPHSGREIVLGTSVLREVGKDIGQPVRIAVPGQPAEAARIVGRAIFPYFGQGSFTATDLGQGAVVTAAALTPQSSAANGSGYNFVLLTFAPGPRHAADIAAFGRAMAPFCATVEQPTCVVTDQRPNGASNYARIDATPEVLAGVLALLGLAVLAQFAMSSARRRRRELAILKTLGLLRRQLAAITAWQVTTLTTLALLVGLPLGVAVGHWAWALFANEVGLSTDAITPVTLVLLTVPAAILAAVAVTLPAGRHCARLRPAAVLRSE